MRSHRSGAGIGNGSSSAISAGANGSSGAGAVTTIGGDSTGGEAGGAGAAGSVTGAPGCGVVAQAARASAATAERNLRRNDQPGLAVRMANGGRQARARRARGRKRRMLEAAAAGVNRWRSPEAVLPLAQRGERRDR